MNWTEVCTIIGVNIALFGALATLIIWMVNKLDNDIRSQQGDMKSIINRLDGHASRIDQLYVMFVNLLKEQKK